MTPETQDLIQAVGQGMLRAVQSVADWRRIELSLTGAGGMVEADLRVVSPDGEVDQSRGLDHDALDACGDLRDAMHQAGTGTWYNARFTVDRSGSLESEFDYDNAPFDGNIEPELLVNDHAEFPRDPANIPDWHPSKASG
ncbi:hypothetical protein [Nocardioides speluncae]|uniref:hypothetical protein n=1 Tax=Nocardioides speluncae TaxID=2670337 RepID=UPI000D69B986|nr:hypothetical protein [Nocardioides speluncae]